MGYDAMRAGDSVLRSDGASRHRQRRARGKHQREAMKLSVQAD
jgi:hypothetical protein